MTPAGCLDNINVRGVATFGDVEEVLGGLLQMDVADGMVVVDSFAAVVRQSFEQDFIRRSRAFSRMKALCDRLSQRGVIVVVTNEVTDDFDEALPPFDFLQIHSGVLSSSHPKSLKTRRFLFASSLRMCALC